MDNQNSKRDGKEHGEDEHRVAAGAACSGQNQSENIFNPLPLKLLARQAKIMESDGTDSDLSDIDVNTFANRVLRSPRLHRKSTDKDDFPDEGGGQKRPWDFDDVDKPPQSPSKKQKDEQYLQRYSGTKKLDLSASSVDSAVGSSLTTPGSWLSETSSFDSNTDTDDSTSPVSEKRSHKQESSIRSLRPLYFSDEQVSEQFRKVAADADSVRSLTLSNGRDGIIENLILHRLPEENLGMRLSVEGGKHGGHVRSVTVKSVVEDGAAYRASGSSVGICEGDEIQEVNGTHLRRLGHEECIELFKSMPERVHLVVKRASPPPHHRMSGPGELFAEVQDVPLSAMPELGSLEGFILQDVTIRKAEGENLGLSIVPSYGTTRDFYQIKRLLPSGACSRSGRLQVGDRLLECNGQLLKGLTQSQCLSALKKAGNNVTFRILRQEGKYSALKIVSNGSKECDKSVLDDSVEQRYTEFNKENYFPVEYSEVEREESADHHRGGPSINEVFAQRKGKLAYTQPFPPLQVSDDSESITDSSMSSPAKETKDLMGESQFVNVEKSDTQTDTSSQNAYLVDTPVVDLETAPADWGMCSDFEEMVTDRPLPTIMESIPPPMEFADNPPDILSKASYETDEPVPVTNIDDLLGMSDDDQSEQVNETTVQQPGNVQYNGQPCDLLLDINGATEIKVMQEHQTVQQSVPQESADLLVDVPTPDSNMSSNSSFEMISVKAGETLGEENVTSVEISSFDDFLSVGNVTQIPVTTDDNSVDKHSENGVVHVTKRDVNQHIVTKVNVVNDGQNVGSDVQVSGSHNRNQSKVNSAVIHVNGQSDKSAVIHVNQGQTTKRSPIHFVPPVMTATQKDHTGEDVIEPMKMIKEKGGIRVFEQGVAESATKPERRELNPNAKRDLADILLRLTKSSDEILRSSDSQGISVTEDDIVPTKISREDAKKVLGVFETWLSEGKPQRAETEVSPFKQMVSEVIEAKSRPKVAKIRLGSKTPIHVMPPLQDCLKSDTSTDEEITPVHMKKDKSTGGWIFEARAAQASPSYESRKLDEEGKKNLANMLSKLSSSYEDAYGKKVYGKKSSDSSDQIDEEKIVATEISREDAKTLMDVFSKWLKPGEKTDEKRKVNPFKKLVSDVIDDIEEQESKEEEILTVTKDKGETVIEQRVVHNKNVQPRVANEPQSEIIVSSEVTTSFLRPKASPPIKPRPKSTLAETKSSPPSVAGLYLSQETSQVKLPVPSEDKLDSVNDSVDSKTSVLLRPKVSPSSPRLSTRAANRHSTGSSLPALNVRTPLKLGGSITAIKPQGRAFTTSRSTRQDYQKTRREDGPFQVDVLKGIVGLGLKLQASAEGCARVSEIQKSSPVDKNGQIKVGDFVLSINNTPLTGQSDSRIQQVLRLLPRGLARIVASAVPPTDEDTSQVGGSTDSLPSSDKPAGSTSPYGVRLGAKPFNTEESQSVTVTSPLNRDSGFFETKKKPQLLKSQPSKAPHSSSAIGHVSTITVSKEEIVKQEDKKPNDKHVTTVDVKNIEVEVRDIHQVPEVSTVKVQSETAEVELKESSAVTKENKSTSNEQENIPSKCPTDTQTNSENALKSQASTPNVSEVAESTTFKKDIPVEPRKPPKPAPRRQIQNGEVENTKPAIATVVDSSTKTSPVTKSPPRPSPKPQTQKLMGDDAISLPQPKFVSNIEVEGTPEIQSQAESQPKFVSNIAVEKGPSEVSKSTDEMSNVTNKSKNQDKTPPPVPPKPRRTSSASSDASSSSVVSEDFHYENEVDGGQRRRRKSSASSEKSSTSLKSEGIPEEPYVPRRQRNEPAPEKKSVKEKMAAFEAFQKGDEGHPKYSASFVASAKRFTNTSQGQEFHAPNIADPPKPKARTDFVSSAKKNVPEEDGVFIVSRISINTTEASKDETTSPTSPVSPDSNVKLNSALAPKKRSSVSETYVKTESSHHHSVPKASSSIFKPTGLERLKNLAGHKTDSGEVAHSSSPEGVYKTAGANINTALSPRRPSREEAPEAGGMKLGSTPHKLHSGEDKKVFSTSSLSGKNNSTVTAHVRESNTSAPVATKVVHIEKDSKENDTSALVTAKFVHIDKDLEERAPMVHSVQTPVTLSSVTDHQHADISHSSDTAQVDQPTEIHIVKDVDTGKLEAEVSGTPNDADASMDVKAAQQTTTAEEISDNSRNAHVINLEDAVAEELHTDNSAGILELSRKVNILVDVAAIADSPTDEKVLKKENETENVQHKTEEVKEQIKVNSNKVEFPFISQKETPNDVEQIIGVSSGFAEQIVTASLEAAKQEIVTEVRQKDNEVVNKEEATQVSELTEAGANSGEQEAVIPSTENKEQIESQIHQTESIQIESSETIHVCTDSSLATSMPEHEKNDKHHLLPISLAVPPNTQEDTPEDVGIDNNAAEIVSATLEAAKRQLGFNEEDSSPCSSPPPLPGSAPPPVLESAAPSVSAQLSPTVEAGVQNENIMAQIPVISERPKERKEVKQQIIHEPVTAEVMAEIKAKPNEDEKTPVEGQTEVEDEDAPPPLPAGPPPTFPSVSSDVVEDSDKEDNKWVEEIEKVAAQESKFDMLINFDSDRKIEIDTLDTRVETPASDDSGIYSHVISTESASAISEEPVQSLDTQQKDDSSSVKHSVSVVQKHNVVNVLSSVAGAVDKEPVREDSTTDSGVESPGDVSNKTVIVQYTSNIGLHDQDASFTSTESLHADTSQKTEQTPTSVSVAIKTSEDSTSSTPIVDNQITSTSQESGQDITSVNVVSNDKETFMSAPILHSEITTDPSNISVTQVSSFQESALGDAVKDSESSKLDISASDDKIFSSTPTKQISSHKTYAFDADVSSIQFPISKVNNSQNVSQRLSTSTMMNTSFNVSPKSKASFPSKRHWRVIVKGNEEASDASELPDTSSIARDDLSSLISMANQTMDKTGISLEDEIVVVTLARENPEQDLGFQLRDGVLKSKVVSSITSGGLTEKSKSLKEKDSLLAVNGKTLESTSAEDVMKLLAEPSDQVTLVISRGSKSDALSNGQPQADTSINGSGVSPETPVVESAGPGVHQVIMKKGVTGVGFCLEGGKGSPKGDMPILIKRIFKGGPAEKCGQLKVQDEILQVNEIDFTTLRHYEAWNHLKYVPDGDVRIVIRRK